jgi:hypothetical protein
MKLVFRQVVTMGLVMVPILFLNGCYTQVGTVRSERWGDEPIRSDEPDVVAESSEVDTTEEGYEDQRDRFYYDYYYPPSYPYLGLYRPYNWSLWWNTSLGYDPFLCGTYYPSYYGWWDPRYFYYTGYFYPPYAGGYYGYRYASVGGTSHGVRRTTGNTRGTGSVRESGGNSNERGGSSYLPTGSQSRTTVRREAQGTNVAPNPSAGRRESKVSGTRSSRGGSADRSGTTRSGSTRRGGQRESVRSSPPRAPQPSGESRGSSGRSRGERTYSPPASSSPAPSSPAPARGSSSSGGTRGGGGSRDGGRK